MLTLHTNPHAIQGRSTLKDECERQFWNASFRELKERINDVVHEQSMTTSYEQSMIPKYDFFVSCCTEANNSVADQCQMNRNIKKWTSMSEGSDNFAM